MGALNSLRLNDSAGYSRFRAHTLSIHFCGGVKGTWGKGDSPHYFELYPYFSIVYLDLIRNYMVLNENQ